MGWRGRIGLVFPNDSDADDDYVAMVPKGVTAHVSRNEAPTSGNWIERTKTHFHDGHIEAAARLLQPIHVSSIAYACVSGSFAGGPGYDREIVGLLERIAEVPATTGITACFAALNSLGVTAISLASPYPPYLNDLLVSVLEAQGVQVQAIEWRDVSPEVPHGYEAIGMGQADIPPPEIWYGMGKKANRPSADAIFIPATSNRTATIIEPLEQDLGKPVITANQVIMWHALRLASIGAVLTGYGSLFARGLAGIGNSRG